MNNCLSRLIASAALAAGLFVSQASPGAELSPNLPTLVAGTSGDAVCTRCHDANEKKPILPIHRTRHGVASQPGCQAG